MRPSNALGLKSNDSRTDTQPTTCPTCGTAITGFSADGADHIAEPCGHSVSSTYIGRRRVATDGGRLNGETIQWGKFELSESDKICPSCGQQMLRYYHRHEGTDSFGNRLSEHDVEFFGCPDCVTKISDGELTLPQDQPSAMADDEPDIATDGGYDPCPSCGADPETCYRCQSCGYDLTGRTTSGREATQR